MNEQTNNRIREEWIDRYIKIHNDTDCCQRETVKNFIAELLKSQKDNLVEKIEKYKVKEVKSDFDFEHNITCDDILSLIKEE